MLSVGKHMCLYVFVNLSACLHILKHLLMGAWKVWLLYVEEQADKVTRTPFPFNHLRLVWQGRLLWSSQEFRVSAGGVQGDGGGYRRILVHRLSSVYSSVIQP